MHVRMYYSPPDDNGGGGGGGDGGGGFTPAAAPWSAATDVWSIGADAQGQGARPWWDTITEEPVRQLLADKKYKNPGELAMAYHNANKLISGGNVVQIPSADADDKAWGEFFAKTRGGIAAPDKYEFKFPEGVQVDEATVNFGRQLAYDLGLPPKAAQMMADRWNSFVSDYRTKEQTETGRKNDEQIAALKTKYGADFDANMAAGKRVLDALGYKPEELAPIEAAIGAGPLVDLLVRIGNKTKEGNFMSNGGGGGGPSDVNGMTPEQANAEIARLQADEGFQKKYTDRNHPENKASVERMQQLYARASSRAA